MENWSAQEDDRPYIRPARSLNPWIAVAAIGLVAWLGAFYFRHWIAPETKPAPQPAAVAEPPAPLPPVAPRIDSTQAAASLPTLENSDSMMRDSLAGLVGRQAFADHFIAADIVRRIVATVDNLPRETAPRRVMPLNPVPGAFVPDTANYVRYEPYVRVFDAIDPHDLVQAYVRAYPLFQSAYEELGYPGKYFNDRLMRAIDDLLDAPEPAAPPELLRPRVLYEFADPDLETRSAGQKMLLRMGRDNAARVKGKLREIRRELVAATVRR